MRQWRRLSGQRRIICITNNVRLEAAAASVALFKCRQRGVQRLKPISRSVVGAVKWRWWVAMITERNVSSIIYAHDKRGNGGPKIEFL